MFNKVFISYAREDFEFANGIYDFLNTNIYNPWMDKKKLLVGQKWEYHIMDELKTADYIIILLSKTSVAKRGFVQREFKYALKYAEEKLNSDIFILPIKLDDCIVPEELSIFNWVEYNESETNKMIIEALNSQRNKMMASIPKDLIDLKNYTEQRVTLDEGVSKVFDYDIRYPIFHNTTLVNTEMLNTAISNFINEHISFINAELDEEQDEIALEQLKENKYTYEVSYVVGLVTNDFASIMFYEYTYFGGAYPNNSWKSINVSFNRNRILSYCNFINLENLKLLLRNYKFYLEGNHDYSEQSETNLEFFNEFNDSDNFYPKRFEYLLLDKENISINLANHLPHVAQALGQFELKYLHQNGKIEIVK